MEYYSKPIKIKAIQFNGLNVEDVLNIISLNKGVAVICYLDKEGKMVPEGTLTEYKAIRVQAAPREWIIAMKGDYIVLNDAQGMYPIPGDQFEQFYVSSIGEIADNTGKTFSAYRKEIEKVFPSQEAVESGSHFKIEEDASYDLVEFIKQYAIVHQFADGRLFYVVNGTVFIF